MANTSGFNKLTVGLDGLDKTTHDFSFLHQFLTYLKNGPIYLIKHLCLDLEYFREGPTKQIHPVVEDLGDLLRERNNVGSLTLVNGIITDSSPLLAGIKMQRHKIVE